MGIDNNARIEARVVNKYLKKAIEPIFRSNVTFGMLKKKGRVTYGHGGKNIMWKPRFRRREIIAGDGDPMSISFPRVNVHTEATLPWRMYYLPESLTKYEQLVSQDKEVAIFPITVKGLLDELMGDFNAKFPLKFYGDGNLAATAKDLHGLESIFSYSGLVASSVVGNPNDSYASLSTALGNKGGSWTGTFPAGTGPEEYHYFSPLIVDYTNTAWTHATKTWVNTWHEAMRYATTYLKTLQNKDIDVWLMTPELLRQARGSLQGNETFEVTANKDLISLGVKALSFEGMDMVAEYGCTANACYGVNFSDIELMSMQSQLVKTQDDSDITSSTKRLLLDSYCNMKIESPAWQVKLINIS